MKAPIRRRILIIDDDVNFLQTLQELLEMMGFEVMAVSSGIAGIQAYFSNKPDLIICDVRMPEMDGLEVLEAIKKREERLAIPFIYLSAECDDGFINRALLQGADEFLTKPFKVNALLETVETKLQWYDAEEGSKLQFLLSMLTKFETIGFHEFNTPMNGILGGLDFLVQHFHEIEEEDKLSLLQAALSSSYRLKRSYSNLLLGIKGYNMVPVSHFKNSERLTFVLEIVRHQYLNTHGCFPLQVKIEDVLVPMKRDHLSTVLYEMIDNALKFGDYDESPQLYTERINEFQMALVIRDFGKNVDPQVVNGIRPFVQHNRAIREQQGWGLGLYLIHCICKAYQMESQIRIVNPGLEVKIFFTPVKEDMEVAL
jgi:two-component system, sensor histidine kinase and response regulator